MTGQSKRVLYGTFSSQIAIKPFAKNRSSVAAVKYLRRSL
jgi:hypothetical protein